MLAAWAIFLLALGHCSVLGCVNVYFVDLETRIENAIRCHCDCSDGASSMEDRSAAWWNSSQEDTIETTREKSVAREACGLAIPFWFTLSPPLAL